MNNEVNNLKTANTLNKTKQEKQNNATNIYTKRVGTISVGVALITTGVAMFLSIIYPSIQYISLFKFAPLLLCLLGCEILLSFSICKHNNLKYDYAGIFLATITVVGAFLLSGSYVYHMLEYSFYLN